jgi:hypothetical protein
MENDAAVCVEDRKRPWLSPWGTAMSRDITMFFRTDQKLCRELETIARHENRSVSSAIATILTGYVKQQHESAARVEKRRYARKEVSVPAMVKSFDSSTPAFDEGLVLDLSLGGLCVSFPTDTASGWGKNGSSSRFETTLALPETGRPVTVLCERRWTVPVIGGSHVGASFIDADFTDYQQLQEYLIL